MSPDKIKKLCENWLPKAEAAEKKTADDKRLIAALKWIQSKESATQEPADDIAY